MKFTKTEIPDVVICRPKIFGDYRGYFSETFRKDLLEEFLGYRVNFCQDNESKSSYGVLRGLHYQLPPFNIKNCNTLNLEKSEQFDIVFGNPPYIFHRDIPNDQRKIIENNDFTIKGSLEIGKIGGFSWEDSNVTRFYDV
ncbi:hypothetical protein LCGC14_2430460, partial [marine sediment metagenome]